jgi:hypothetical protein
MLEPRIKELATAANFGVLSFHLSGGAIASHVMWVDADDDHVLINTEVGRAKYRAITANGNVTVTIWDGATPYTYGEVRGTLASEVRGPDARAHIDTLSQKYTGAPYGRPIGSERVILKIAPDRQRVFP